MKTYFKISAALIIYASIFTCAYTQNSAKIELIQQESGSHPVISWEIAGSNFAGIEQHQIEWFRDKEIRRINLPVNHLKSVFSKNGEFYAEVTLSPIEIVYIAEKKLEVTVINADGEKLYTINRPFYYDHSIPSINISGNDGSVVLGENDSGRLWFYDNEGSLVKEFELFPDAEYDLEKTLSVDVSRTGRTIAVAAGKRGSSPAGSGAPEPDAEPHLFLFHSTGDLIWKNPLPEFNTRDVLISPDGKNSAVNSYTISSEGQLSKKTLIFDENGDQTGQTNFLFKHSKFSPDSRFLVIAENNRASLLDAATGKTLWTSKISRTDGMITAVDLSENADRTAILIGKNHWDGSNFIFLKPQIQFIDQSGTVVVKQIFDGEQFKAPAMSLSESGTILKIGFQDEYRKYRVND